MKKGGYKRLTTREKGALLFRIAQLVEQGYSLMQTLDIILASSSKKQRFWLEKILAQLKEGKSLEEAFRQASFSEHVLLILGQADTHGRLAEAFKQAALWKERRLAIRRQWQKVLVYPAILLFVLMSILYLLFQWVIPQFLVMFRTFDVQVPSITQKTIQFFQWWQQAYPTLILLMLILSLFFLLSWKSAHVKERIISYALVLPWIKKRVQDYYTLLFALQLGSLLQANIPLHVGMDRLIKNIRSSYLRSCLTRMEEKILAGQSVAQALKGENCFSHELYPVVYYAERKGALGQHLVQYGIQLEADVQEAWLRRIKMVEPMVLTAVGCFIAYLFYALFTPVLEMISIL